MKVYQTNEIDAFREWCYKTSRIYCRKKHC